MLLLLNVGFSMATSPLMWPGIHVRLEWTIRFRPEYRVKCSYAAPGRVLGRSSTSRSQFLPYSHLALGRNTSPHLYLEWYLQGYCLTPCPCVWLALSWATVRCNLISAHLVTWEVGCLGSAVPAFPPIPRISVQAILMELWQEGAPYPYSFSHCLRARDTMVFCRQNCHLCRQIKMTFVHTTPPSNLQGCCPKLTGKV